MENLSNLPHLLKLLDDESPSIRESILKELRGFGASLEENLVCLDLPLNSHQKRLIKPVLEDVRRSRLKQQWPSLFNVQDEYEQIELAHRLICEFQLGRMYQYKLKFLLDQLAEEFCLASKERDVLGLAKFLFQDKHLIGVENDYYNPKNSNLVSVILDKQGIPMSLAVVYMLVGYRIGLSIEGCNFPGHFLARVRIGLEIFLVDCFNNGEVIREKEITRITPVTSSHLSEVLHQKPSSIAIIERVIRNLIRAYQLNNKDVNSHLMVELLNLMKEHYLVDTPKSNNEKGVARALFKQGQLVKHKRYGYRGVVVDFDMTCQADKLWYESNQTQPTRFQPWYHILVHEASHTTYAAQTNLVADDSGKEVIHPLVPYFFTEFISGLYIRNDKPWGRYNA